jgi:hypothetical protein
MTPSTAAHGRPGAGGNQKKNWKEIKSKKETKE